MEDSKAARGGGLTVRMRVGDPAWLTRLMLRLGDTAELVDPPELADGVRRVAAQACPTTPDYRFARAAVPASYGHEPASVGWSVHSTSKEVDMTPVLPLALGLGPPEIILIILVVVLLFGAKKLPELARGSGRALRIFKAETKGLLDDDDDDVKDSEKTEAQRQLDAQRRTEAAQRLETPVQQPRRAASAARPGPTPSAERPATHPHPELTCPSQESSGCSAPARRTAIGADGRMALADHLRELRARLLRVVLVLIIALIVALFFYDQLLALVLDPYNQAPQALDAGTKTLATINGVGGPLLLQLKLCGLAAVVITSPYWLLPDLGLHRPGAARQREALDPACSRPSPARCSSSVSRSATTCCPRASTVLISFTPAT